MHKRHKGKNKQKHSNPPQQTKKDDVQKEEVPAERENPLPEEIQSPKEDSLNVEKLVPEVKSVKEIEFKTQNIQSDENSKTSHEENVEEIPPKPKRHRAGKKKKQNEKEQNEEIKSEKISMKKETHEAEVSVKTEPLKEEIIIEVNKDGFSIAASSGISTKVEEYQVTPVTRKKKGKQNKNATENSNDKQEKREIEEKPLEIVEKQTDNILVAESHAEIDTDTKEKDICYEPIDQEVAHTNKKQRKTQKILHQSENLQEIHNINTINEESETIKGSSNQDTSLFTEIKKVVEEHNDDADESTKNKAEETNVAESTNVELVLPAKPPKNKEKLKNKSKEVTTSSSENEQTDVKKQKEVKSTTFILTELENLPIEHKKTDNYTKPMKQTIEQEDGKNKKKNKKECRSQLEVKDDSSTKSEKQIEEIEKTECEIKVQTDFENNRKLVESEITDDSAIKIECEIIEKEGLHKGQGPSEKSVPIMTEKINKNTFSENVPSFDTAVTKTLARLLEPATEMLMITDSVTIPEKENPKEQKLEHSKPELTKYTPLSEKNIDESYKKLFEALLVNESSLSSETKSTSNVQLKKKAKEEDFIIRLFDKPTDSRKAAVKTDSTDLKCKVMEVNKDMEDLQLSIEKSIAELTAVESDDMPELVAITECPTPPSEILKETVPVCDVESRKKNLSDQTTEIQSFFSEQRLKNITAETEMNIREFDIKEEEPHKLSKKNKGKGKSSKPPETYTIPEVKEDIKLSSTPILTKLLETPIEETKCLELEGIKEEIRTISEVSQESSSPEPTPRGKNKNKKNKKIEQFTQQSSNIQSPLSPHTENKGQTLSETQTSVKEEKDNKKKDDNDSKDKQASDQESATDKTSTEAKPHSQKQTEHASEEIELYEDASTLCAKAEGYVEELDIVNTPLMSSSCIKPVNEEPTLKESFEETDEKPPEDIQIENPLASRSKNLLGPPDIPVASSKNDYKKEKNKNIQTPNNKQAKIKVKDCVEVENDKKKYSKESQTENKLKSKRSEKGSSPDSDNEEYVYKYSFRKVFLTNCCNICTSELNERRFTCNYCNLVYYCSQKHKDEDWASHQALCFAVSTLVHLKGLKFIYGDAIGASGQDYRLLRMQIIISCEKILKRKLLPFEQEVLLYPRICAERSCREWRSGNLTDCDGCGLVSYCSSNPQHLPKDHQNWCRSYRLYYKLVTHQQTKGRLEPKLPSKVIQDRQYNLPDKINELLAHLYEEKIDMDDVHYAALTQLASAPLTAAYSLQLAENSTKLSDALNGLQDKVFTIHVVGAELQFEADTLNKWEVFFLHLRPDVEDLKIVFVGPELNPSKLPLDLLAKIKMCRQCRQDGRKISFEYQDGQLYHNYAESKNFIKPDVVCAFNPGLHRTTGFGGVDSWPQTINSIVKEKIPFCVTSYTKHELPKDLIRVKECSEHQFKVIVEPTLNPYASIRPDRNFISDDEMPLIFKNYYLMILCGTD